MKIPAKIFVSAWLSILMIQFAWFFILLPGSALAADDIKFTPQVGIPGAGDKFGPGSTYTFDKKSTQPIAEYIQSIYKYAIAIVGILATMTMMLGGAMWIVSGGSAERAGEAKAWISASLTGLLLTILSYLILATVNPALTNFNISKISQVDSLPIKKNTLNTDYEKNTDGSYKCCNPPNIIPTSQTIDNIYIAPSAYDSGCGAGFYCNNGITPGVPGATDNADPCAGFGYCTPKLGDNSPCSDTINCLDGFQCLNGRCKASTIVNAIGKTCQSGGICPSPLKCIGAQFASWPGLCYSGEPGSPCCSDSDCLGKNCSIGTFDLCTRAEVESATYRCY